DIDAESGIESVTLGVAHGILTLGTTAGLTTSSGNGTGSVSMTGTVSALNTALSGLSYKSGVNFNSSDTLTITTNDQGNTGSGGTLSDIDTVTITVHDATAPSAPSITSAHDDVSPQTALVSGGGSSNDTDLTVKGK